MSSHFKPPDLPPMESPRSPSDGKPTRRRIQIATIGGAIVLGLGGLGALLEERDKKSAHKPAPAVAPSAISSSTASESPSPSLAVVATATPTVIQSSSSPTAIPTAPTDSKTQIVEDPADASPSVVDIRRMRVIAGEDDLVVTWTVNSAVPRKPNQRLYYAFSVKRFDASGNGDSWQVAGNWPGDAWYAHVFRMTGSMGQTSLPPPLITGNSIQVRVPWRLIGGRNSFKWDAGAEAGDDINNDEVPEQSFVL